MRRHFFTLLSALSLLLCGYLVYRWAWPDDMEVVINADGRLILHYGLVTERPIELSARNIFALPVAQHWKFFGIEYARTGWTPSTSVLAVPLPYVILLTAALPALWGIGRYRSTPHRLGTCSACGYDMRATPEQCPECGAVPTL